MPSNTICFDQELQPLVLQLRADIVGVRTAADHLEEKLKAEILFLKEQIQAEQCLKDNLEDTLQLEIEGCKEEIGEPSRLHSLDLACQCYSGSRVLLAYVQLGSLS